MTQQCNGQLDMSKRNSVIIDTVKDREKEHGGADYETTIENIQTNEELVADGKSVRREFLKVTDGVYIQGRIQGIQVEFVADTGAARTIMSDKVYRRFPTGKRPSLNGSCMLNSVNGDPLKIWGKANFKIQLGDLEFCHEIIVAEIEDECLLGLDILGSDQFGPVVINMGESYIAFGGVKVRCSKESRRKNLRQVTLMDDYRIPPKSQMIVKVMIHHPGREARGKQ